MKLQKLTYYSQVWSLVWDEAPIFQEEIRAWANGPVVRELYDAHKGLFKISAEQIHQGSSAQLTNDQKETIDGVLNFYGDKTAQWLSDLTHMEDPWKCAREEADLAPGQRGDVVISHAAMHEYYSSL